ncbi:MAG: HNH endonuclease [Sulfuricella sp.]|nr:HNH endonuclease [Sulfuricella sp.]
MAGDLNGTSLGGYGQDTYKRYHYTCVYCGFDGRVFDSWMQLSIDHIRPRSAGGTDDPDNLVVACRSCNSITSRMTFSEEETRKDILTKKRERVALRRKKFYELWQNDVAPNHLERPLPKIK